MCGIIGYIGKKDAVSVVLEGLKRLEYRGYDSAGIAFFSANGIEIRRCTGKIKDLASMLESENPSSYAAIGHTRWATHGRPSDENAHPHRSRSIVLVHNGIVENYLDLKARMIEKGYQFNSETDTEVLCHLIEEYTKKYPLEEAIREALKEVKGSYALVVIKEDEPDKIVGVRKDSPLVVGLGDREFFLASDVPAFLSHSKDVIFLDDGEMAVLTGEGIAITGPDSIPVQKEVKSVPWSLSMAEKGGYKDFMLKEIYEQPRSIGDTLKGRLYLEEADVNLDEFGFSSDDLKKVEKIFIVACGTSYHAGLIGKYMVEELARVPTEVDVASEFRYRRPLVRPGDLMIVITQSGETADTLAAQRETKKLGAKVLSICNVVGSTSSREADAVFYTHSGPEIGVASTKAFTAQLVALYLFTVALGKAKDVISENLSTELLGELLVLPGKVEALLAVDEDIRKIAKEFFKARGFLYLGRGINYPIALEGALKLKEISYIHAEGYPAGEMKHGPIALIDEDLPVVVLAPVDNLHEKILSNLQEVKTRGGKVISITNDPKSAVFRISDKCVLVPNINPYLTPVLMAIPVQLLAYHVGVLRGCDVDQPRNLAKSVTVE
ncbi:MAG TPA: glutamine--fructose-6-phosphate transaminase (isomerizing) [Thermodesulfovibrionales bacterium]|nr:glutamine--fructose-6-phosphate transaminase (isomerizing) [Thermodesulfovibrionales bacterium]